MLISQTVSRLRPRPAYATSNNVPTASGMSSLQLRRPFQIRAFRFGMCSSYLDPAYERELRRRYRALKRKYVDDIYSKSVWNEYLSAERLALKRDVARFWVPPICSLRSTNQDAHDGRKGATPSMSNRRFTVNRDSYWTPPDVKSGGKKTIQSETNPIEGQGYMIDPITNRKVSKREHEPVAMNSEPPARTPNPSRSPPAPFNPPNSEQERQPVYTNGKPPASELSKYAESDFDDWPTASTQPLVDPAESSSRSETASYVFDNSALKDEEYSLNHLPLDDPIEDHDDLHKCQTEAPGELPEKRSDESKHSVVDGISAGSVSHCDSSAEPSLEPDRLQSELQNYGPYMHNEGSPAHADPKEPKDLEKYRYRASEEPECAKENSTVYDDLDKYVPTAFDDIKDEDRPFQQYGDLEKYKAYKRQYLDTTMAQERDIVAESLKEYEAKSEDDTPRKIPRMKLPKQHIFSDHYSSPMGAETQRQNKGQLASHALKPLGEQSYIHESVPTRKHDSIKGPHGQENQGIPQSAEIKYPEVSFSDAEAKASQPARDRPCEGHGLESALNHCPPATKGSGSSHASGAADLYSKEPQGLETSFSEECGGKHTMPLYRRTYGNEPGQSASISKPATENEARESLESLVDLYRDRDPEIDGTLPGSTGSARNSKETQPDEPTVYKILAYDPTMQAVNVAETTSVVPDLASPLSPTEVLLRLSNPAKFFPHFAPLQAEGFEIVSGGGDILVFRQVRPAKPAAQGGTTYVNPIDMMGRSAAVPNAAAFVSPTGFVNYDMPRVEEPAEPPFRSNIDVRREEPVFSGQKSSSRDKESRRSKKPRMNVGGRIIVGGAWVAGISYALGVVSEYFHTGGADGKGPTGFSPI
ncbi:hypothetical protein EKO27_g11210 [Xylaria grammica]|uniref:Uncharacterized protein n=1 Tax=Xylaria grammica TaxID=363999 RepID=A0A439CP27_9PEZI|nr:hypothetical protein EKO27_g11210 [Xylaria grammica]